MLKLDHHPFRLDVIVNNVIAIFSSSSADKNIELLLDIAPDIPLDLIGDSLRIQQILTNLLGNAVKFTEKEGIILIRINAEPKTPDTVMLSCSVKDTGIGMTSDQRDMLFEAFTQGDTSTTKKEKKPAETISGDKKRDYSHLSGLNILVAEDNRVNQEITVEILKSVGITARVAADGKEAVNAVFK